MSGIVAALAAFAGGDIAGKLLVMLAGRFGGRVVDRFGDWIDRRRAAREESAK